MSAETAFWRTVPPIVHTCVRVCLRLWRVTCGRLFSQPRQTAHVAERRTRKKEKRDRINRKLNLLSWRQRQKSPVRSKIWRKLRGQQNHAESAGAQTRTRILGRENGVSEATRDSHILRQVHPSRQERRTIVGSLKQKEMYKKERGRRDSRVGRLSALPVTWLVGKV